MKKLLLLFIATFIAIQMNAQVDPEAFSFGNVKNLLKNNKSKIGFNLANIEEEANNGTLDFSIKDEFSDVYDIFLTEFRGISGENFGELWVNATDIEISTEIEKAIEKAKSNNAEKANQLEALNTRLTALNFKRKKVISHFNAMDEFYSDVEKQALLDLESIKQVLLFPTAEKEMVADEPFPALAFFSVLIGGGGGGIGFADGLAADGIKGFPVIGAGMTILSSSLALTDLIMSESGPSQSAPDISSGRTTSDLAVYYTYLKSQTAETFKVHRLSSELALKLILSDVKDLESVSKTDKVSVRGKAAAKKELQILYQKGFWRSLLPIQGGIVHSFYNFSSGYKAHDIPKGDYVNLIGTFSFNGNSPEIAKSEKFGYLTLRVGQDLENGSKISKYPGDYNIIHPGIRSLRNLFTTDEIIEILKDRVYFNQEDDEDDKVTVEDEVDRFSKEENKVWYNGGFVKDINTLVEYALLTKVDDVDGFFGGQTDSAFDVFYDNKSDIQIKRLKGKMTEELLNQHSGTTYTYEIKTADILMAAPKSRVSFQVIGSKGKTGYETLSPSLFERNEVTKGEFEASDVGTVEAIELVYKSSENGWDVEYVTITKGSEKNKFECGFEMQAPNTHKIVTNREKTDYKIEVKTQDGEIGFGTDQTVVFSLETEEGHTSTFVLEEYVNSDNESDLFEQGDLDKFTLNVPDFGAPKKIGFKLDGFGAEAYRCKYVEIKYKGKSYFSVPNKKIVKDNNNTGFYYFDVKDNYKKYEITVTTADDQDNEAGTDADVFVTLKGEKKPGGIKIPLDDYDGDHNNDNLYEEKETDKFYIVTEDVGKLTQVKIEHDDSGPASGWLLESIKVKKGAGKGQQLNCRCWLQDDNLSKTWDFPLQEAYYQVNVTTADEYEAGTDDDVYITINGTKGSLPRIQMDDYNSYWENNWARNSTDEVKLPSMKDIGDITSVVIYKENNHAWSDGWKPKKIVVIKKTNATTTQTSKTSSYQWTGNKEIDDEDNHTFTLKKL